ncbi:hypothetical protein LP421_07865 [Rhizobium sp. RCAM05350]|nr:hypothetical protein LP421_07865 [Rhizobium sp. RCAM05350]
MTVQKFTKTRISRKYGGLHEEEVMLHLGAYLSGLRMVRFFTPIRPDDKVDHWRLVSDRNVYVIQELEELFADELAGSSP